MIRWRRVGPVLVWASALIPVAFWLLSGGVGEVPGRRHGASARFALAIGQAAGLSGMALLSASFVLSARLRWLEDLFGGLDGMYRTHHRVGLTAFALLLAHPVALALRFAPDEWGRAVRFLLPTHARWAVDVGVFALWLMIVLIGVTLISRIPYDTWKWTHKGLGLVLLGGGLHMVFLEGTPGQTVAVEQYGGLRLYMMLVVGVGLIAAAYKTIVLPLRRPHRYVVSDVTRLNDDVMEVQMEPRGPRFDFVPGQFVFVTFRGEGLTRESHPYTLCSPPDDPTLRITVKALGDYTKRLYEQLEAGVEASLEGPYGRFDYRDGGRRQIWIAGGVGVAPFLSWVRMLEREEDATREVDFYYCVHDCGDAVYTEEFEAASETLPEVDVALICSVEEGHLHAGDIDDVEDADVFMCGPKRLTRDLRRQFRRLGVRDARIHFEDFEFR